MNSITVWNPALNAGAGGVHVHTVVTGVNTDDPENPVQIISDTMLARVSDGHWTRRGWPKAVRINPDRDVGFTDPDLSGLIILDDTVAPSSIPAGKKRGTDRETPLIDLEAGTAVWYTLVDKSSGELAADLAVAATAKRTAINTERERRIYLPIGPVDLNGDQTLMVEPDIRNEADRQNLIAIHTRALSLVVAGVTAAVIKFGAADNEEYTLTPAQAVKLCEAPFDRASGYYVKARELKDGALAAAVSNEDTDAVNAIDEINNAHWS